MTGILPSIPDWMRLGQALDYELKAPIFEALGYTPHENQVPIHASSERFRVVCCGRRFGKSTLAAAEAAVFALLGGQVWTVAPTYDLASIVFEEALRLIQTSPFASMIVKSSTSRNTANCVLSTGGKITSKSSERPKSLLGRGNDLFVFDECSKEGDPEVYHGALRPTLTDRVGSALLISTPTGDDWFKELWDRGDQKVKGFAAWQMPTAANPFIPRSEIRDAQAELDLSTFEQEYLAQFLDATGAVFRGYRGALSAKWQAGPIPGHHYVIGVDIARYADWTVICVIDCTTREVVHYERFNLMEWALQAQTIASFAKHWNWAPVVADATSVGDPICERIEEEAPGLEVFRFVFTPASKTQSVNDAVLAVQKKEIKLLAREQPEHEDIEPLVRLVTSEIGSYRYERSASGRLTMNAPKGRHDDTVTATVLAWQAFVMYGSSYSVGARVHDPDEDPRPTVSGTFSPPVRNNKKPRVKGRFGRK